MTKLNATLFDPVVQEKKQLKDGFTEYKILFPCGMTVTQVTKKSEQAVLSDIALYIERGNRIKRLSAQCRSKHQGRAPLKYRF